MTAFPSRLTAALATAALVGAGVTVAAGPASAESPPLGYDCTVQFVAGNQVFYAVIDTNAPATLATGASASITTTTEVIVPAAVVDVVRDAGAKTVGGTATATGYVDGVARDTTLTIPKTPVPETPGVTMDLVGSGPSGSITAGSVGSTIALTAGDFSGSITGYDATDAAIAVATFTCVLQPEQITLVDAVSVVKTATTTTLTVAGTTVEYGDTPVVTATVTQAGSNAKPAGKIAFTFEGKTVTVDVKGGKAKATTLGKALHRGANTVTAVFTPTDPTLAVSEAAKAFTVVKAPSTTAASAVYKAFKDKIVARAKVTSAHGTAVAGQVKYVLKRNGVKIRTKTVDLNRFDVAKAQFRSIVRRGDYTVIARYLGSATLKRSNGKVVVEI